MRKYISMVALALAVSFMLGCATSKETPKQTPIQKLDAPKWVIMGSGAFKQDDGRYFYGVSSAAGINNFSLLRTTADNRAINEVAKVLQTYTSSLMKDYMASTADLSAGAASDEQNVELAVKTVTSMSLTGVQVIDHWQNPDTGELFSLAKIDLQSFKDLTDKSKELNSKAKEYIKKNADVLHGALEVEEQKMLSK